MTAFANVTEMASCVTGAPRHLWWWWWWWWYAGVPTWLVRWVRMV